MDEELAEPTREELKRKAYTEAIKLARTGIENEVIYARLEKQGIPIDLIAEVLKNLYAQKRVEHVKENVEPYYRVALMKIALGLAFALISFLLLPGQIIIPIGFLLGGVIWALILKGRMK